MIVGINIEYFRELVSNINTSLLFLLLISTLILQILEMFYIELISTISQLFNQVTF
jgi:hypothetical protein